VRVHSQAESRWFEDYSGQFGGRDLVARCEAKTGLTEIGDVNAAPEDKRLVATVLPDCDGTGWKKFV
jgi:hypothetical protein